MPHLRFYDLEHYVKRQLAGIERCLMSRLSSCCPKTNCEQLQQYLQVTYTSQSMCTHDNCRPCREFVYIMQCLTEHHSILKSICTFQGATLSVKASWIRKLDLMKPTSGIYAWLKFAELESALVIAFEGCSLTTRYLTSCRCWAKASLNCSHSYSRYFFFQ